MQTLLSNVSPEKKRRCYRYIDMKSSTLCLLRDAFICSGREYLASCGLIRAFHLDNKMFVCGISQFVYDSYLCAILLCLTAELLGHDPVADFQMVTLFPCFLTAAYTGRPLYCITNKCIKHFHDCCILPGGTHYFLIVKMKIYFRN